MAGEKLWGGLLTPTAAVLVAVQAAAVIALFHRFFHKQHEFSAAAMQDWGHAYAIPFIAGYLVWRQREELRRCAMSAYWPGVVPFLFGIVSYFFFVVGVPNHMLQGASVIITIFGLVLMNLGPRAMKYLFLPIAFLATGMTISEKIMIYVTFPLQLIASKGGYVLLNLLGLVGGFHSEVTGNQILVITDKGQTIPLNIAEACSGLRMLIAFVALGAAVALISCKHWWQRIALLIMAPVVALFMNVVRVAILGIASIFDPQFAAGDIHMLIGTLLLVPSLMLFLGVVWVLNRVSESPPAPVAKVVAKATSAGIGGMGTSKAGGGQPPAVGGGS